LNNATRIKNLLIFASALFIALLITYFSTLHLQDRTALMGWGPQDYVSHKLIPENFVKDFDSGLVEGYDNSFVMQLFIFASKAGISLNNFIPIFIFLQSFLFCLSVAFLAHSIFKRYLVTLLALIIIPVCDSAGLNLARFGLGFGGSLQLPLYYGISYALMFFSFALFLRGQLFWCFLSMAATTYCHVTLGLFTVIFVLSYIVRRPKMMISNSFLIGSLVFAVVITPHFLHIFSNLPAALSEKIPADVWLRMTRLFGCHWYPITFRLFIDFAQRLILPLMLICVFGIISIRYLPKENDKRSKIIIGCVSCLILSVAGVIFADVYPIPFLIKLALHRATGIVTFFCILCAINYLVVKFNDSNFFVSAVSLYSLFLLVIVGPGIALLPILLFSLHDIYQGNIAGFYLQGRVQKSAWVGSIILSILFIIVVLINSIEAFSLPFNTNNVVSIKEYWWHPLDFIQGRVFFAGAKVRYGEPMQLIILFICIVIYVYFFRFQVITNFRKRIKRPILVLCLVWMIFLVAQEKQGVWKAIYGDRANAYYNTQIWAKENTTIDSLFLVDPSQCYGWRDFSQRSSFGCIREWGYTVLAYLSSNSKYEIGKTRFRYFGVDIDNITDEDVATLRYKRCGQGVASTIRKNFYSMSLEQLSQITHKEYIDFIVLNKAYIQNDLEWPIAYENDHYLVISAKDM